MRLVPHIGKLLYRSDVRWGGLPPDRSGGGKTPENLIRSTLRHPQLTFLLTSLLLTNCNRRVMIRYNQLPAEMHSAVSLGQMMRANSSPKIVLRVPQTLRSAPGDQSAESQSRKLPREWGPSASQADNTLLYNTVEKQLFREGFSVRDRVLFNEVLDKATSVDYLKVNDLTNTDLILEWINIDREVTYNTNRCYRAIRKGRERELPVAANFRRVGASVEFKLIHVKTNEVVGTYKLHYSPCTAGCPYVYKRGRLYPVAEPPGVGSYEVVNHNELELFMTDATKQLVQAMR